MSKIVGALKGKRGFDAYKPASEQQVSAAQQALNLTFSSEYTEYVRAFGFASFFGHELTGVCPFPRLSVVDVTLRERANNPGIPANLYVIEQTNFDGIVIWQSQTGEVYMSQPGVHPSQIAASLAEYLDQA